MKRYKFSRSQFLPVSKQVAWDFFSNPQNLNLLTPGHMNFEILFNSASNNKMQTGQRIGYKVNVLPLVRVYWETEITHVTEGESFIDIQRKGPFAYWSHTHSFCEMVDGVEMTDQIEYAIPFGAVGQLANVLFVDRNVKKIFKYRADVLVTLFKKPA